MPRMTDIKNITPSDLKQNPLKAVWNTFLSLDTFTKLLIITLVIALPIGFYYSENRRSNVNTQATSPDQLEAEGGVLGGNAKIVTDTTASGGQSVLFSSASTPTNSPSPTLTPTPTTTTKKVVTVSSIVALKTALADNTVDEIVVTNGTYYVSGASNQYSDSLWIGSEYASRTNPVLVRAQTIGGVTFDGRGSGYFIGLSFNQGAHDQTWQGFKFANGEPTQTGVIVFGGDYGGNAYAAPHHITLLDIEILGSITSDNPVGKSGDHAMYISQSVGGPHDILIDRYTVDGSGGLDSAIHFYHSTATQRNGWNVTVRNMTVNKTDQAIIVWDATVQNIVIEDSIITNATDYAVRYEQGGTLTLRRVTSTGSGGGRGFYSSLGSNPPGVTFDSSSLQ